MAANRGRSLSRVGVHAVLAVGALVTVYPLIWLTSASLKESVDILGDSPWNLLPSPATIQNYTTGWKGVGQGVSFAQYTANSLILAALTVVGSVISCSLAAYAFGRLRFRFKSFWFALMLGSIMLPFEVVIIPQYILFNKIGWVNTYLPILAPQFFAQNAFLVFLITQFVRSIPKEIDEAAAIDGAGPIRIYWSIVLPLSVPALATAAVLAFLASWSNLIAPLIYLNDPKKYTLPLGLSSFLNESGAGNFGALMAMSAVALIIPFIVFLTCQRYILRGVAINVR